MGSVLIGAWWSVSDATTAVSCVVIVCVWVAWCVCGLPGVFELPAR